MNLLLPVLSLLLSQTGPVHGIESTWPADFNASLSGGGFHQPQFYGGWQVGGDVGANWYLRRPVVDDGTPLAMQPFLQRLDRLSFDTNVAGFGAKDDLSLYEHSGHSADVSLSGLFYLRDVILGGELHYARAYQLQRFPASIAPASDERHTTQLAYPELTLGVRSDTLECKGSYRFKTYFDDGAARASTWGQAVLDLRSFSEPQTYWKAALYTLVRGAGLSFEVEFFASPRLGIWFEGYVERGVVYMDSQNDYNRKSFSVGVGWWKSSRLELQFSVRIATAERDSLGASTLTSGLGTFGVVLRAPRRDRVQAVSPLAIGAAE
jgi:hypothetical protein